MEYSEFSCDKHPYHKRIMKYVLAIWHLSTIEEYEDTPISFFYEVENGKSIRGLERFINNSYTLLPSNQDVPTIDTMNDSGGEFTAFEIRKSEFEFHWSLATKQTENG